MLRAYEDLTSRLGEPLWWDDNGVPRYDPFHPKMTGVYARFVVLVEIGCQACPLRFNVSFDSGMLRDRWTATRESVSWLHYGDPPPHGCVGDTMNCEDLRVLEFWRRDRDKLGLRWERDPELEICYPGTIMSVFADQKGTILVDDDMTTKDSSE